MALRTDVVASFDGGAVRIEIDWDDLSSRVWITAVRCVNLSASPVYVEAVVADWRPNGGRKASAIFLPGTTTEIPVSTTVNQRLQGEINVTNGRLDGFDIRVLYPYTG